MGCCSSAPPLARQRSSSFPSLYSDYEYNPFPELLIKSELFIELKEGRLADSYNLGRRIGSGSYGQVFEAVHIPSRGNRAIKVLNHAALPSNEINSMFNEMSLLKSLVSASQDHPNIIKIYEVVKEGEKVNIVAELCSGGDMLGKVKKEKTLSEKAAATYLGQILSAVAYCHERGIVHRDIKLENILLETNAPSSLVKIIDFGTAKHLAPNETISDIIGTVSAIQPLYIAPEVLSRRASEKCDIWSCGVVLYIFLSGKMPFRGRDGRDVFQQVRIGTFDIDGEFYAGPEWAPVSPNAKDLVLKMLTKNPLLRPCAKDLLAHPWFRICEKIGNSDVHTNLAIMNRLKTFKSTDPFRRASLNFIASQLTTVQETEKLRRRFIEMDENKDGKLSKEEITKGFSALGLGENVDVEEIFRICDTDKSGYVDYTEFITMTLNWQKSLSDAQIQAAFQAFDRQNRGSINLEDIKHLFTSETASETDVAVWQEMLEEVDENGDGVVDLEEFKHMVLQRTTKRIGFQPKLRHSMP